MSFKEEPNIFFVKASRAQFYITANVEDDDTDHVSQIA